MFTERTLRKLVFGLVWFGLVICKELAKKQNVIKKKKSQDTKFCKWRGKLYLHTAGADRSIMGRWAMLGIEYNLNFQRLCKDIGNGTSGRE